VFRDPWRPPMSGRRLPISLDRTATFAGWPTFERKQSKMFNYYVYTALARERQKTFLAQAEAGRRAEQARSHRQSAGTSGARKSPLRRIPNWLSAGWSRLLPHRPRSAVMGSR
jgi:hypothetical protein